MKKGILVLFLAFLIWSCSSQKNSLENYNSTIESDVSYSEDIRPIIERSCFPCHAADSKKEHFTNYEEVKDEIEDILYRVQLDQNNKRFMPFKKKKPSLNNEEITLLKEWAVKGFKE